MKFESLLASVKSTVESAKPAVVKTYEKTKSAAVAATHLTTEVGINAGVATLYGTAVSTKWTATKLNAAAEKVLVVNKSLASKLMAL